MSDGKREVTEEELVHRDHKHSTEDVFGGAPHKRRSCVQTIRKILDEYKKSGVKHKEELVRRDHKHSTRREEDLTKSQKRHKCRMKQRWRLRFNNVIKELKKQQTAAIRERCWSCHYEHGLLKDPCVEHLPTLTDVECMVIGYCQNSGCNRCLVEWRAGIDCCDENTKCRCLELFPRKNRTLIERRSGGIRWIMDKGRKPVHLWQDIRALDEASNGWASARIRLTTGAFVPTGYGYDEIGIGLTGYEDPNYIPPYWKEEFIRYAFHLVIRRKPVRDLFTK